MSGSRPRAFPRSMRSITVGQLLDRWHKVIVATRRETTAINYRYVIDSHLAGLSSRREKRLERRGWPNSHSLT